MIHSSEIIKIFLAFIVLINPSAVLSFFLQATAHHTPKERQRVAQIACLSVFVTIVVFALMGESLLLALGISLGSFRVAGGVLLFLIALSMINGSGNPAKPTGNEVETAKVSFAAQAVVPIAIPMMIGPGGISTVIIYASQVQGFVGKGIIIAIGFVISLFCFVALMAASQIKRMLGETGIDILSRIMGILLAAVAIEILVAGLRMLFPEVLS